MTNKELLKPRWKVIADYPKSVFNVGDIIINNSSQDEYEYISWEDYGKDTYCPNEYPAIFKKLEWWEERELEDLPEYIKSKAGKYISRVESYWIEDKRAVICGDYQAVWLQYFEPATEEEYLNQK